MNSIRTSIATEQGFTLVEMLIATVVLLVGLVAVAQLVPTSVMLNANNRNDGTAMVFAQQMMEALREQPLTWQAPAPPTFSDPQGVVCPLGETCSLGDPNQPNQPVGNPVILDNANVPIINFSAPPRTSPRYSFTYTDPNDPYGSPYDVRWAVITSTNSFGQITSRRIIVGVFRPGMKTPTLPVTIDSQVEK